MFKKGKTLIFADKIDKAEYIICTRSYKKGLQCFLIQFARKTNPPVEKESIVPNLKRIISEHYVAIIRTSRKCPKPKNMFVG